VAADPRALLVIIAAAALGPPLAYAQEAIGHRADADAIAKELSNPVAALISVPPARVQFAHLLRSSPRIGFACSKEGES
jgi:hypothetical protein